MAMKRPGIYAPLSAYYFDDAAIMEVGEDAELLYVRMLAYAARQMEFEGFISDRVILTRLGIMPRESGNGTGNVPGTDAGSRAGGVVSPVRIQRRRTKGWRTPLCSCGCGQPARYVGRGTKWGNPSNPPEIGVVQLCG